MKEKRHADGLFMLDCGSLFADKGAVTYKVDIGKEMEIPVFAFLIKSGKDNILYDTGLDLDDYAYMTSIGKRIKMTEEDILLNRLKGIGLSPEDINCVIMSHLHWDHSGLLRYFKKARIFVQGQEYGYAIHPPPFADAYRLPYYDSPDFKWQVVNGDEVLLPGITAIFTPGHTPGHQSLMVDLPQSGTVILTGDCAYLRENVVKEIIPGLFVDPLLALQSIKKLKNLARLTGAKMIHSHSPEQRKVSRSVRMIK